VDYASVINPEATMTHLDYARINNDRLQIGAAAIGLLAGLLESDVPIGCESNTARARELVSQWDAAATADDEASDGIDAIADATHAGEAGGWESKESEAAQAELRG
jgi:hypothetical protein